MVIELFLILLLGASILVVLEEDLIRSLIFLALASIFLIILIYMYKAPDVSLTFSVVSSGASVVLFLVIIKKLEESGYERKYL